MSWISASDRRPPPPPPPPEDDEDVPPPPPPLPTTTSPGPIKPPTPVKPLPEKPPTPSKPLPAPPPKAKPVPVVTTTSPPSPSLSPSPSQSPSPSPSNPSSPAPSPASSPLIATASSSPSSPGTAPTTSPFPGVRLREPSSFPGVRADKPEKTSSWSPSIGNWSKSMPAFLKSSSDKELTPSSPATVTASSLPSSPASSPAVVKAPLPIYEPPPRAPLKAPKIGKLRLIVTEGRNLSMKGREGPDAQCTVGPVDDLGNIIPSKSLKTDIVRNSARPVWSSIFNFATKDDFKGLLLECWDEGKKRRFLGQVDFPPQILIDGREIVTWFSLGKKPTDKTKQADVKGDIYLSILFSEGAVIEEPPEEKKPAKKIDLKRTEQADSLVSDIKGGNLEALKALVNYIVTSSIYSDKDAQIIDPEFATAVVKKNGLDALLEILKNTDNAEVLTITCYIFSILSEVDSETATLMASKGIATVGLQKLKTIKVTDYSKALSIFTIAKNVEAKQKLMDADAPSFLFSLLKSNLNDASMVAITIKSLNNLASEGSDSIRKAIAMSVLQDNLDVFVGILDTYNENEQVIEPAITFVDQCFEFVTPVSAVGTKGIDIILCLMQKYRLTVQVHGASILSRLMEESEYAQHTAAVGVPIFVKMLGTEFFLRHYEQRSRELSLKCLNRCATTEENIHVMRDANLVKFLDAAMRTYSTMIVQLQGVLLIKAIAKDEVCRQQLVQIGIGQLLTSAAGKHPTLTRLHKMVDDLKATYGW